MRHITYITIILIFVLSSINLVSAQEYKIIVNSANPNTTFSKKEISEIFLKKKSKWSDNTAALPIDLSSGSPLRAVFSKDIHNKSVSQIRAFWQQSVFSGKASPPVELENDAAVINYIKTHKGAVGYISAKTNPADVKTITLK